MNSNMNGQASGGGYKFFQKVSDINKPTDMFVTIDEYQVTINDAMFLIANKGNPVGSSMWMNDWPALYHNGASGLCFADGHADAQAWRFLGYPPANYNPASGQNEHMPESQDTATLLEMSTVPASGSW